MNEAQRRALILSGLYAAIAGVMLGTAVFWLMYAMRGTGQVSKTAEVILLPYEPVERAVGEIIDQI